MFGIGLSLVKSIVELHSMIDLCYTKASDYV